MILTDKEANKVFSWLPYRPDWPIDRSLKDDNINDYYGGLIEDITLNKSFDTYYSEDGGLGNYLEFFCYPKCQGDYNGNAIMIFVSLCSPIAGYGQTTFLKTYDTLGLGQFISPDELNNVSDTELKEIERLIFKILISHNLALVDKDFASRSLPVEVADALKNENHNAGNQYLHGLFQKTD